MFENSVRIGQAKTVVATICKMINYRGRCNALQLKLQLKRKGFFSIKKPNESLSSRITALKHRYDKMIHFRADDNKKIQFLFVPGDFSLLVQKLFDLYRYVYKESGFVKIRTKVFFV